MSKLGPSDRRIIKVSRTANTVPLTGMEDVVLVDPNRLYNHGYKHFLAPSKILEIFGERVARSKKIRKARIREILKKAMHSIQLEQGMVVNQFISDTDAILRAAVAEVQAMQSSPQLMETDTTIGKRRKTKPSSNEVAPSVPAPILTANVPMDIVEEPLKIDPLENQLTFIIGMIKKTDFEKSKMTERQVEKEFKKAKMMDDRLREQEEQRVAAAEKKQAKEEKLRLRGRINNDIADLFSKTGL